MNDLITNEEMDRWVSEMEERYAWPKGAKRASKTDGRLMEDLKHQAAFLQKMEAAVRQRVRILYKVLLAEQATATKLEEERLEIERLFVPKTYLKTSGVVREQKVTSKAVMRDLENKSEEELGRIERMLEEMEELGEGK